VPIRQTGNETSTVLAEVFYPAAVGTIPERCKAVSDMLRINALGMKCPRPIVELAKARRRASAGACVEIVADDLAFESDVHAWCETTGSELVEMHRDGIRVTAVIRIPAEGAAAA
jgi:tRNA 2-thiouridine synthesizing protein A